MSHEEIIQYAMQRAQFKAKQLVGRHGFNESDVDDIRQELITEVIERLPKFDGDRASAKTFVSRLINNRIADLIAHQQAGCRQEQLNNTSLDEWVRDEAGEWVQRDATVESERSRAHIGQTPRSAHEQSDLAMDVASVIQSLPADLRDLCQRLQTQTVMDISRESGVSRSTVYQQIKLLRDHFTKAGLADYLQAG